MNLLRTLNTMPISEDAAPGATSAASISAAEDTGLSLFSQMFRRPAPKKPTVLRITQDDRSPPLTKKVKLAETMIKILETQSQNALGGKYDTTDIIAKLKSLETKNSVELRNTVEFGLEDDKGGIVRVSVPADQANEFERALQTAMSGDDDNKSPDVAEVMFKVKDDFTIVDVRWPDTEEDEEEEITDTTVSSPEEDLSSDAEEIDVTDDIQPIPDDTEQVKNLLTQVIDMMQADAQARMADARAREAEAKNREAEALAAQTMARVKQEEQILDMETYNKAQKEEDREAKRLAQLAKWKHQQRGVPADITNLDMPGDEEEEVTYSDQTIRVPNTNANRGVGSLKGRVSTHDIAKFLINRVK